MLPDCNGTTAEEMQICSQLTESCWRNHQQQDKFSHLPAVVKQPEVWGVLTDLEHWVFYHAQVTQEGGSHAPFADHPHVRIQSSKVYIFRSKQPTKHLVVPPERDASVVIGALAAAIFPELQGQGPPKPSLSDMYNRGIGRLNDMSQRWIKKQQKLAGKEQQLAEKE